MNATTTHELDVDAIRREFPILGRQVNNKPLVYLDNAASTQKPAAVIDAMSRFYQHDYANIHRAVHELSQHATELYEEARAKVARFLRAQPREIVFTRGATEATNLVMNSFARPRVQAGDEVLITAMEHHSNIVPWQMLCQQTGAHLRVAPISDTGELLYDEWEKLLSPRVKLAAFVHISNALGTINPVARMVAAAHDRSIPVLIDAAQSVPHVPLDVQALDCDFLVFSGHKVFGPSGAGALYGKLALLEAMPPWQGGGDMIRSVTFEKTEYADVPTRFEAGTPAIVDGIGLGAALDYVSALGMERIAAWEHELLLYATSRVREIEGVRLIGTAREKASVLSFVLDGIHATDAGMILDQLGIAVRAGHHCAQPVMDRFKVPATIRASFAFYNTKAEVDALVNGLMKVKAMMG